MAVHGENKIKLQALTDKHRQVASLLAQGLGRTEIAALVEFTPEYVTWLARDPLFKDYLRDMSEFSGLRLEAMFDRVADAVDDGLSSDNRMEDRLKAARLQLEVTGRIGKGDRPNTGLEGSLERLATLAERLLALQSNVRKGETINGNATLVNEDPDGNTTFGDSLRSAQPDARGFPASQPTAGGND